MDGKNITLKGKKIPWGIWDFCNLTDKMYTINNKYGYVLRVVLQIDMSSRNNFGICVRNITKMLK